jgi:K+-sensing histidine kinase KdpD
VALRSLDIELIAGGDSAPGVEFARSHKVTQIFIARPQQHKWPLAFGRGLVERVVRLAHDIQVTIVAERRR